MLAAVYGPRAVPPRREQADRAVVEVVVAPATATRGPALRSTSSCVASAVRAVLLVGLHPRTGVTVALQARLHGRHARAHALTRRARAVGARRRCDAGGCCQRYGGCCRGRAPSAGRAARCVRGVRARVARPAVLTHPPRNQLPSPSLCFPTAQCWWTQLRSRSR